MKIQVKAPNGEIIEFPEGTPDSTIVEVMAREYPQAKKEGRSVFGRARDAISQAFRGDAAEQAPTISGDAGTLARRAADKQRGFGENIRMAGADIAAQVFGDDIDIAKQAARSVPGATVTQDANQNPMVQLPSGERLYANQPGFDTGDIARFAGQAASFIPSVAAARRLAGANTLLRAGLTGAGAGGTDIAGQAAGRDDVDYGRAGLVAGLGGVAEVLGPAIMRGWSAAKSALAGGASTKQAAAKLATESGLTSPTNRQINEIAGGIEEIKAGADPASVLGRAEFGFIYTKGQKLPEGAEKFKQLSKEESLRQYQGVAGEIVRGRDRGNVASLGEAVSGIAGRLGKGSDISAPVQGMESAQNVIQRQASQMKGDISDAYGAAAQGNRAAVSVGSIKTLPDRLARSVADFDLEVSPATLSALNRIKSKVSGLDPNVSGVTLRAIESQRKVINNGIEAAVSPADRKAMIALKREYDNWADEAFNTALVSGDPASLAAIKEARSLRAEFGKRFEGKNSDVDNYVRDLVAGDKTPDELINVALGASQVSKASAGRFIDRLRIASGGNEEAMNALKAAHFMRLTTNKSGETLGFQAIMNNIKQTERNNPSIIRSLYNEGEWAEISRLAKAIEPLVPRGDFARTSGTAERLSRMMQVAGSSPLIGRAISAVSEPFKVYAAQRTVAPLRSAKPAPTTITAASAAYGD